jgi:hypothetical protein
VVKRAFRDRSCNRPSGPELPEVSRCFPNNVQSGRRRSSDERCWLDRCFLIASHQTHHNLVRKERTIGEANPDAPLSKPAARLHRRGWHGPTQRVRDGLRHTRCNVPLALRRGSLSTSGTTTTAWAGTGHARRSLRVFPTSAGLLEPAVGRKKIKRKYDGSRNKIPKMPYCHPSPPAQSTCFRPLRLPFSPITSPLQQNTS